MVRPSLLAYLLVAVFLVAERRLRRGEEARTLDATASDRGTTRLVGAAYGYALNAGLVAQLLSRLGVGRIADRGLRLFGLVAMALGIALRVWAARTLGRFYTRTLRATSDQPVVRDGPYRLVRHPGYLASLVLWAGFGLATGNWLAALSIDAAMALAYARRMDAEEAMLVEALGAPYAAYRRETARLLPGVY